MKQKKQFVLDKAGFFYRMNTQVKARVCSDHSQTIKSQAILKALGGIKL